MTQGMSNGEPASSEIEVRSPDGVLLHARRWIVEHPRAVLVMAHGFGEHSGCYDHVADALARAARVETIVPDLRGHGRSPGRRGVVREYAELIEDLAAVIRLARGVHPTLPLFLLGHSNGGLLALRLVLDQKNSPGIAGLILSNPALRVATRVRSWKLSLGRFLLKHAPAVTLSAKLKPEHLTRDVAMQRRRKADRLIHEKMSAPLYFGMVDGGPAVMGRAGEIREPILMILGASDPVIDPDASRDLFDRLGSTDKTLMIYPGMRHEPFNEVGREKVFEDVAAWVLHRCERASEASP